MPKYQLPCERQNGENILKGIYFSFSILLSKLYVTGIIWSSWRENWQNTAITHLSALFSAPASAPPCPGADPGVHTWFWCRCQPHSSPRTHLNMVINVVMIVMANNNKTERITMPISQCGRSWTTWFRLYLKPITTYLHFSSSIINDRTLPKFFSVSNSRRSVLYTLLTRSCLLTAEISGGRWNCVPVSLSNAWQKDTDQDSN